MSERQKSQKGFVAVTLITLLAIATVIVVYAALLGTFRGGEVTVGQIDGTVQYSLDNSTNWSTNLYNVTVGGNWYARFSVNAGSSYSGPAKITWQLQNKTGPNPTDWVNWDGKNEVKDIDLAGGAENIYSDTNWGNLHTTTGGTYRLEATIESTG